MILKKVFDKILWMILGGVVALFILGGAVTFFVLIFWDRVDKNDEITPVSQASPFYKSGHVSLDFLPQPLPKIGVLSLVDNTRVIQLDDPYDQVTLVHFWTTWCVPCQRELPHLLKFSQDPDLKNVRFVFSSKEAADDVKKYLEQQQIDPTNFYTHPAEQSFYNSIPRTYIVDKDGKVRASIVGSLDWSDPTIKQFILNP